MDPQLNFLLQNLADHLWQTRNKKIKKKTIVGKIPFRTSDGVDGLVKVVINPRLPYLGFMETRPKESRDPMDFVMELQPKEYGSRKNLYLTIYHEMLHATDPSQSTKFSPKYILTYNEKTDKDYWGHPIEFRAISNEFLEGLEMEISRRLTSFKNSENKKYLLRALDNILSYFSRGEQLSNYSLDILRKVNDEDVLDNMVSKHMSEFTTRYPEIAKFMSRKQEEKPYYLTYVEMIKEYNPEIWSKFLTMLYKSAQEMKKLIENS